MNHGVYCFETIAFYFSKYDHNVKEFRELWVNHMKKLKYASKSLSHYKTAANQKAP